MSSEAAYGPYELLRRLGSGGMAETYLAVRRGPGGFEQHVCVKRILPAFEADPEFVRQFMDEARLAAQLRHANITQVVDFGVAAGSHYLALELVDGMDLRTLLERQRRRASTLDAPLAVYIAMQLATALDFAHTPERARHAVVHRDISPSNIVLSRAGEVYLTDFGIARALGQKRNAISGVVRGKVPYMAAEYAEEGVFDARADLFSLGVVLYEMLTGRRPYEGATDLDTVQKIREGDHPPLLSLAAATPPALVAIVEQLLAPSPDRRFQSATALLEAFSHVAPPSTVARQLGELVRSLAEPVSMVQEIAVHTRTAQLNDGAAPSYPEVAAAHPDQQTRASNDVFVRTQIDPQPPDHGAEWSSTDPSQISHHDRPAPHLAAPAPPSFASPIPATRPLPSLGATPTPRARRPIFAIVLFAIVAFSAAAAVSYGLIEVLSAP